MSEHVEFMRLAIVEAQRAAAGGDWAVGCVIVRAGEVIALGSPLVRTTGDPTDHAEIVTIRRAAREHHLTDFTGCTLYTTFEPCPMCAGAILWSNFDRLVYGSSFAAFQLRHQYRVEVLRDMVGGNLDIISGVLAAECDALANW
ncbi:MAG: nucleoside deaminase [Anaerolineales bacterium]